MTLKQLSYVVTVAETGSITEAAKQLYIAQPSLTTAVKELEQEYGITIFHRSKKGIELTPEGDEFLGYARQLLDQANLMNARYTGTKQGKQRFCVSAQHYSFAVEAFVKLIQTTGGDKYEFHMRETQTYDIIDDVAHRRSEIGVLYLNTFNEPVIRKTLRDHGLTFTSLFRATPHVFIGKNSPLAAKREITLEDLAPYPRLSYEQGSHNSFYFSEEILSTMDSDKEIIVRDRATLFNLLVGLNGYTICSGILNTEFNGRQITAVPLEVDDYMEIGYITHNKVVPSRFANHYIDALKRYTQDSQPPENKKQ